MSDYQAFKHGAVQFPLPLAGSGIGGAGASLLRDADPALFFLLEFFGTCIQTHLGARFAAEATASGAKNTDVLLETLPFNPEGYLTDDQVRFPMLAAWRKSSKSESIGNVKHAVDEFEVVYALPSMTPGEAERLMPSLKAVTSIVSNRCEQGMDPAYTPSGGTAGQHVWQLAGISTAEYKGCQYGAYTPAEDLYFPCVIMSLEIKEKSDVAVDAFENSVAQDIHIDIVEPLQGTAVTDFIVIEPFDAPTITSASPNSGTKAGGTTVTLTGTGFRAGATVKIGNVYSHSVTYVNATTLQFVTPAHDAFNTYMADIVVTNVDGQQATLEVGYTFTSP